MVKLCFTYRAEPQRTIEARRGISLELQTKDVYTELGTDPIGALVQIIVRTPSLNNTTNMTIIKRFVIVSGQKHQ